MVLFLPLHEVSCPDYSSSPAGKRGSENPVRVGALVLSLAGLTPASFISWPFDLGDITVGPPIMVFCSTSFCYNIDDKKQIDSCLGPCVVFVPFPTSVRVSSGSPRLPPHLRGVHVSVGVSTLPQSEWVWVCVLWWNECVLPWKGVQSRVGAALHPELWPTAKLNWNKPVGKLSYLFLSVFLKCISSSHWFHCLILGCFGSLFKSWVMFWWTEICLAQLACGQIGFIICAFPWICKNLSTMVTNYTYFFQAKSLCCWNRAKITHNFMDHQSINWDNFYSWCKTNVFFLLWL